MPNPLSPIQKEKVAVKKRFAEYIKYSKAAIKDPENYHDQPGDYLIIEANDDFRVAAVKYLSIMQTATSLNKGMASYK